jgi:hypothetical protein
MDNKGKTSIRTRISMNGARKAIKSIGFLAMNLISALNKFNIIFPIIL